MRTGAHVGYLASVNDFGAPHRAASRLRTSRVRRGRWLAWYAAWLGLVACGSPPPPRTAGHDDVRAIQRDEAILEESATAAHDATTPCPRVCEARARMEAASGRICAVATERDDSDLIHRCDQAQRRTDAAALAGAGACQCAGGS